MNIEFDNFVLRRLQVEDADKYFFFIDTNRERISKYFPVTVSANSDLNSTASFIAERVDAWEKREFCSFVICEENSQKIIGSVFLKDIDWKVLKSEIGYFIDGEYSGKGIISKAVSFVVDYCFRELKLNKVYLRTAEDNVASIKVAEKTGFQLEGKLRQDFKTYDGKFIDVLYYGLLAE